MDPLPHLPYHDRRPTRYDPPPDPTESREVPPPDPPGRWARLLRLAVRLVRWLLRRKG